MGAPEGASGEEVAIGRDYVRQLEAAAEMEATLGNIPLLYLTCSVLLLLSTAYLDRFWTQMEAFLAFRAASSHGLIPAPPSAAGRYSVTKPDARSEPDVPAQAEAQAQL